MLPHFRGAIAGARNSNDLIGSYAGHRFAVNRASAVLSLLLFALALRPPFAFAQGLDPAELLKPPTDTWPTYNGDYSGRRFSTLDQINAGNINSLTLAWVFQAHGAAIKSTPLEVNGILYFSVPDNVWAVDARFGRQIWHYERKSEGDHIGNRGLGMYKNWLYFTTPDSHLVCLNAKDGTVRWIVELADPKLGGDDDRVEVPLEPSLGELLALQARRAVRDQRQRVGAT